jgi:multicomponent Na+:H+ antiporter subunit E
VKRRVLSVLWLVLVWVALWGSLTWANVLGGLAVSALVIWMVPLRPASTRVGAHPLAAIRLTFYFLWQLIRASAIVAWEVVTPWDRTAPAVIAVPLDTNSPGILTTVANMVSMTPGTLTLDVDPGTRTLYVHVLHWDESVVGAIRELERLVVAAFGSSTERRAQGVDG